MSERKEETHSWRKLRFYSPAKRNFPYDSPVDPRPDSTCWRLRFWMYALQCGHELGKAVLSIMAGFHWPPGRERTISQRRGTAGRWRPRAAVFPLKQGRQSAAWNKRERILPRNPAHGERWVLSSREGCTDSTSQYSIAPDSEGQRTILLMTSPVPASQKTKADNRTYFRHVISLAAVSFSEVVLWRVVLQRWD